MSIIIGADIVPTKSNYDMFRTGNMISLIGEELYSVLNDSDYRIFNLEVPLVDKETPIRKSGPCLIAPTSVTTGLVELHVNLVTLANNHIMDQGIGGLLSTCEVLRDKGIGYVGVGKNRDEARTPYYTSLNGNRICIYACVEHEFSVATSNQPGANGYNPCDIVGDLEFAKKRSDYIIVLYHGGKEHYRYPSPELQKTCRFIIECGADIVICQHSHCIGCKEEYKSKTIIYGQGNFIFDHQNNEFWNTSLLVKINDSFDIEYIPIKKVGCSIKTASKKEAFEILSDFYRRSNQIQNSDFVHNNYKEFAIDSIYNYLRIINGKKGIIYRVLNKISKHRLDAFYSKRKYRMQNLIDIENIINCEAHRELFLCGIKELENNRLFSRKIDEV